MQNTKKQAGIMRLGMKLCKDGRYYEILPNCGCEELDFGDDGGHGQYWCALHGSALDMLMALKDVRKAYQEMFEVMPVAFQTYTNIVDEAIAKAEGRA